MHLAQRASASAGALFKCRPLLRYKELAERQIIPHLGAHKIQKLAPEHVQQWHGALIGEGLAPRTVGHAHRVIGRAGLRLKPPKTKRGRRNITLPTEAVTVLRAHKVKTLKLRLKLEMGNITPSTLVFGTVDAEVIRPRNLSKAWWRARAALKLPAVSFHAFRHSHASVLLRRGVDVLTVSRRSGHANASVTLNVYGHLIEGADAAAAKAIEGMLK